MKNIGTELAAKIIERFQSEDVKQLLAQTKDASDGDTGTFEVVITTENLDRYQEVIKLDGWDVANYLNNPVVLWGHDHSQLIGMATSLQTKDGKMIAKGKFAPTAEGQEKRNLYDLGFLRATSVGFIEKEREGNLITKAELLEFSFVSVPANPYALSLAMEKDLSVNELVTKGIMFVEKDQNDTTDEPISSSPGNGEAGTVPESEEQAEEPRETPVEPPKAGEERSFSTKQLEPVLLHAKALIVALEALGTTEEPEGDGTQGEQTDEEKQFAEFSAKRQLIQDAATVIGDVLAEARRGIQARA